MEFTTKLEKKPLNEFLHYHHYTKISGIFEVLLSVAAIVALFLPKTIIDWSTGQQAILIILALLFLVIQPMLLISKSGKQIKSEMGQLPFHSILSDEGISVSQGEESLFLKWEEVRKIVYRKNVVYLYTSPVAAFVIPKDQIEEIFDEMCDYMKEHTKSEK